jgi:hypothetical protein
VPIWRYAGRQRTRQKTLFHGLFSPAATVAGLAQQMRVERSPRMADFALWQPPVKRRFGRLVPFCASMQEGPQIFCAPVLPQAKMCRTEPQDGQEIRAPWPAGCVAARHFSGPLALILPLVAKAERAAG